MAKIKTDDYENLPIEQWNATTYRAYMSVLHQERYGIPYTANNVRAEVGMISNLRKEHGNVVVKRFIELCFETHVPKARYPGLNFGFMYSFMRGQNLPMLLKQVALERLKAERTNRAEQTEIDTEWF